MNHEDFEIGRCFWCGGKEWRCTDKGTRVIVAIEIQDHTVREGWDKGPPYACGEFVFDEYDVRGCSQEKGAADGA